MQTNLPTAIAQESISALKTQKMRDIAGELEATFLSQMLQHAGLGEAPETFGGGIGEAQFSSMLRDIQAEKITESGGIGLAEAIFRSLEARVNG